MELIEMITKTLMPGAVVFLILSSITLYNKRKIYMSPSSGWLDIKKYPIPNDIKGYLGTDGKTVDYMYDLSWGPHGEILFNNYDKTYLTHWQALPAPPTKRG